MAIDIERQVKPPGKNDDKPQLFPRIVDSEVVNEHKLAKRIASHGSLSRGNAIAAIADNSHEVWAYNRKQEGWTYGPERDDAKKFHPDMIAYNKLPESEKLYDREMAMNTIKLLKKLGWKLTKDE